MLIAGTVRGRLGYALATGCPTSTGGFAWTFDRVAFNDTGSTTHRSCRAPRNVRAPTALAVGWTIGAGVEFPFAPNWTARAEYLFSRFRRSGHDAPPPPSM